MGFELYLLHFSSSFALGSRGGEGQLRSSKKKQSVSFENAVCGSEVRREERLVLAFPPHAPEPSTGRGGHLLVGVLAEDVLDDHDGFLNHVVDLGLDEIKQRAHTALCRLLWGEEIADTAPAPTSDSALLTVPGPRAQSHLVPCHVRRTEHCPQIMG